MASHMSMYCHFEGQLSRTDLAMASGIVFVDILDRKDGGFGIKRTSFLNTDLDKRGQFVLTNWKINFDSPGIGTLADCFGDDAKRHIAWKRGQLRVLHYGALWETI